MTGQPRAPPARDGCRDPRAWVRQYSDGRAMSVAAYATHAYGRANMNIAIRPRMACGAARTDAAGAPCAARGWLRRNLRTERARRRRARRHVHAGAPRPAPQAAAPVAGGLTGRPARRAACAAV